MPRSDDSSPRRPIRPPSVPASGHRLLPHTADVRFEAWGPTREACLAEAVRALARIVIDTTTAPPPTASMPVTLPPTTDIDLLVSLLEEVIYDVDVLGVLALDAHLAVDPDDGALAGHLDTAPLAALPPTGCAPKAITRHNLLFAPDDHGAWRCLVTVDV